jgi:hypothetical protein
LFLCRRRFDAVAFVRNIASGSWDEEDGENNEEMEVDGVAIPGRNYRNQVR